MTRQRDLNSLQDMVNAANLALDFLGDLTEDEFSSDLKTQFAVIKQLEIIGEAARRISTSFKAAHPSIPCKR